MIELQSNNNRIARRIFETLCEGCTPNILTANSLELTPAKLKAKGFPEKYDIVMGNPPFQKGRNMMFYVYFIDLANKIIKLCKGISLIWLRQLKKLSKDMILYHLIPYKKSYQVIIKKNVKIKKNLNIYLLKMMTLSRC